RTVTYYHDAAGNQRAETDPDGYTTFYNFDPLNRLASKSQLVALYRTSTTTHTDTATNSYFYDLAGNLSQKTDADGRVTAYSHNFLDQVTQEQWFDDATGASAATNTIA